MVADKRFMSAQVDYHTKKNESVFTMLGLCVRPQGFKAWKSLTAINVSNVFKVFVWPLNP